MSPARHSRVLTALGAADALAVDEARAQGGDGLGFGVPLARCVGLAAFRRDLDVKGGDGGPAARSSWKASQRLEARLAVLRRQRTGEAVVHVGHDGRTGTEVGGDGQHAVRRLRRESFAGAHVGRDIGPPEAVDRLLGVAHQEKRAGAQPKRLPVFHVAARRRVAAEAPEDLRLQGIGVLELVDQDGG